MNSTCEEEVHITPEEMDSRIAESPEDGKSAYTQIEWGVSYRDCVGSFLTETIPALQKLGAPDDVRIVFWFDN